MAYAPPYEQMIMDTLHESEEQLGLTLKDIRSYMESRFRNVSCGDGDDLTIIASLHKLISKDVIGVRSFFFIKDEKSILTANNHSPYEEMILEAIRNGIPNVGSCEIAIYEYIKRHYLITEDDTNDTPTLRLYDMTRKGMVGVNHLYYLKKPPALKSEYIGRRLIIK